jgi:hypothetical protein
MNHTSTYFFCNKGTQMGALTYEGVCPCGGKLKTAEWETEIEHKGRTTCKACGRTQLKTKPKPQGEKPCHDSNQQKSTKPAHSAAAYTPL